MSNLVDHFRRELERFETDKDYIDGMCRVAEAFSSMGHSGGSASVAIPQIYELLQYKNLGPLTSDPNEWFDHSYKEHPLWQNRRNGEAFSYDGGKTYYLLSENNDRAASELIFHTAADPIKKEE